MAPADWRTGDSVAEQLYDEGYKFDFFQAVRLLERLYPAREPVGRNKPPARELARFKSHLSLSFPPSAIQEITKPAAKEAPIGMTVAFMGLTGIMGALPRHYTELLFERVRVKDTALRDFLDLFNHRLISLFYRVWLKHHVPASYEHAALRGTEDKVSQHFFALMGLGTKGLRRRIMADDRPLLAYTGLMSQRPRSASALQQCLSDLLQVTVHIKQLIGTWVLLADEDLTRLGSPGMNNAMGRTAIAGTYIWDQQARFRIRLGPLTYEQFARILPPGQVYPALVRFAQFFAGPTLSFDVQPILKKDEVPPCRLAKTDRYQPYLGWTTWLKTKDFARDAEDVVFTGRLDHGLAA